MSMVFRKSIVFYVIWILALFQKSENDNELGFSAKDPLENYPNIYPFLIYGFTYKSSNITYSDNLKILFDMRKT